MTYLNRKFRLGASRFPIFAFWEGKAIPPYLELCMKTWRNAGKADVVLLGYSNVHQFAKFDFSLEDLQRFPIAQQADALRIGLLNSNAGVWMDCDTLVLSPIHEITTGLQDHDVVLIGNPSKPSAALSCLSTSRGQTAFMQEILEDMTKMISARDLPEKIRWDYIGTPFYQRVFDANFENCSVKIVDSKKSGFYHEAKYGGGRGEKSYREYWFNTSAVFQSEPRGQESSMLILHNSYTPRYYKKMGARHLMLRSNQLLSQYLRHALLPAIVRKPLEAQIRRQSRAATKAN